MNKILTIAPVAGCLLAGSAPDVLAQTANMAPIGSGVGSSSSIPSAAFFIGLAGSYNSADFASQSLYAQGVSAIFQSGNLVGYGSAGGTTDPNFSTASQFSPGLQAGYFQHFAGTDWLWGAKLSYNYLGATSTSDDIAVPQAGSFTSASSATFTGNVVVRSFETEINNQIALVPFIGRSFDKSYVYFGAGPSVAEVQTSLNGVIGFAEIDGSHYNITGTPSDYSSNEWTLGGTVVVGATYFFNQSWFADLSYAYSMTQSKTTDFAGPFSSDTDGYTDIGILSGYSSGSVNTQSLTISLNKTF